MLPRDYKGCMNFKHLPFGFSFEVAETIIGDLFDWAISFRRNRHNFRSSRHSAWYVRRRCRLMPIYFTVCFIFYHSLNEFNGRDDRVALTFCSFDRLCIIVKGWLWSTVNYVHANPIYITACSIFYLSLNEFVGRDDRVALTFYSSGRMHIIVLKDDYDLLQVK